MSYKEIAYKIHEHSGYTYKQIRKVYTDVVNKHPNRNKYYARLSGLRRLHAFYSNIK